MFFLGGILGVVCFVFYWLDRARESYFDEIGRTIDSLHVKGYGWVGPADIRRTWRNHGRDIGWLRKLPPRDEAAATPVWRGDSFETLDAIGEILAPGGPGRQKPKRQGSKRPGPRSQKPENGSGPQSPGA
jgi:hypothetical protein